jgi:hypothetical protein
VLFPCSAPGAVPEDTAGRRLYLLFFNSAEMQYVEKVYDGFHYYFFDLNAATLSGAIDVIVVPQEVL